jgi:hypothetical protein
MAICRLVPLVLFIAAAAFNNADWYLDHHRQSTKSWLIFVVALKFHPLICDICLWYRNSLFADEGA